ncbi:VWA domain-containing protein [Candidatus Parcubacteria bacterium]|nr:VWA domain-containing protein [Patescibacteria group bacterium]MCG2689392.1 VWA domain-containing protein [Candidatus Parcubacteria bacterium]
MDISANTNLPDTLNPSSYSESPQNKKSLLTKYLLFGSFGMLLFVILTGAMFFVIKNNFSSNKRNVLTTPALTYTSNTQSQTPSNPSGTQSNVPSVPTGGVPAGGTPLFGSKVGLIKSAVSTRNLTGMLLQVNQIDICEFPNINIYSTITNKDGETFSDVRQGDFEITVDGKKVENFGFAFVKDENIPLSTTLVLDHSGSMKGDPIVKAKESAIDYIDKLKPVDEVALIQFDTQIELLQRLTQDKEAVKSLINNIVPRSDTALYDVVYFSAENNLGCGRKAVILLTDGRDTASKSYSLDKAMEKANLVNIPIFVVGLKSYQFTPDILQRIAEGTGAQYFEAPTPQDLTAMYQKINDQLRGQYLFILKLDIPKTNSEHRIKISSTVVGSQTTSEKSFIY